MKQLSPVKAIRKNCLECGSGSVKEVALCVSTDCPLYPFRFGTNPNRQGAKERGRDRNTAPSPEDLPVPSPVEIDGKNLSHEGGNTQGIDPTGNADDHGDGISLQSAHDTTGAFGDRS